ncbi:MAG: HPr family phosphocarrier protein [Gemmatimonadota bacterium]|nr:HPr family phosphocarrier protein [Gemmatimonadota bacterium]
MTTPVTARTRIVNPLGLHARPAAALVSLAGRYAADLRVAKDDLEVNAKSIMGVLMLAAEAGSELRFRGAGPDAAEALEALVALVERGFDLGEDE